MDIHCHIYRSLIRAAQSCQLYEYAVKGYSRAVVNVWLRGVLQYIQLTGKGKKGKYYSPAGNQTQELHSIVEFQSVH